MTVLTEHQFLPWHLSKQTVNSEWPNTIKLKAQIFAEAHPSRKSSLQKWQLYTRSIFQRGDNDTT